MTRAHTRDWLDVTEMARELNVSKMTIYRLINSREIPSARIGRSIRVKRAHWEQYLRFAMSR